jgi:hypothetical protein
MIQMSFEPSTSAVLRKRAFGYSSPKNAQIRTPHDAIDSGLVDRGRGFVKGAIKGAKGVSGLQKWPSGLLISISYKIAPCCHGRGRGFEPRRSRHTNPRKSRVYGKWQNQDTPARVLERVLTVLAPFFLPAFPLSEGAEEGAESNFFLPASNTIVITRLLASRFVAEMACVYTSSVIREFAWRNSSCAVLRSTPAARRLVASEWRMLCHPIALPLIPARITAGRMIFLSNVSGDSGCLPSSRTDGRMKSSSPGYGDSFRHAWRHFTTEG